MILHAGFWSIAGVAAYAALPAGFSLGLVGFFAAALVVAILGGIAASLGLMGRFTNDMGPGCLVAALAVIGSAISGGFGARAAFDGSAWAALGGSFAAVLVLAVIGVILRNVFGKAGVSPVK